jgi:hypothetical protein
MAGQNLHKTTDLKDVFDDEVDECSQSSCD